MSIEARIEELGYKLPEVPAPAGSYLNYTRSGNLLFLAGGIPPVEETFTGKVPSDTDVETAQEAARLITLNRLAVVKDAIGSLDKVKQIVTVNGFVNSAPDFYGHPTVINGCSDLLVQIFGDKGKHSRTAMGAAALPLNVSVEINMVVEIED
ncbi:Enamine deaminase RidA, house cleaning of reactive enamine intermediates, YjgF/YER057c/UK114 family [Rubritalea squalenifaciens DSM 18772]|uniref:Enamine deaminase RidA, house cleaning of reactive enamine intermediates, YjgF/YER057c/UK114 family n=1 Tax=Rubritalea squalenifaciens DSM 18772 TaxID=1123071 RepID=A0A1M6HW21_9BACT|nr:RidA family protein [Rubritalea squalenifaciens]SHJ26363.1 Enamine deaminase RidA, house cleaning of reactive enamine intermediates, YjgF/YER057c/UK114 family [Rubritalea squalenifaciens DSM 18772]